MSSSTQEFRALLEEGGQSERTHTTSAVLPEVPPPHFPEFTAAAAAPSASPVHALPSSSASQSRARPPSSSSKRRRSRESPYTLDSGVLRNLDRAEQERWEIVKEVNFPPNSLKRLLGHHTDMKIEAAATNALAAVCKAVVCLVVEEALDQRERIREEELRAVKRRKSSSQLKMLQASQLKDEKEPLRPDHILEALLECQDKFPGFRRKRKLLDR